MNCDPPADVATTWWYWLALLHIFRAYSISSVSDSSGEREPDSMVPRRANTVVIADDFAAFRRLVRSKLKEYGFQTVAEASDGLEAVVMVRELQPDIVLLDIGMPNLDGIKAAAQIRTIAPRSKILFVSQITDSEIVQSALSDGALGYVCKSKINSELLPALEAALGGKRFVSADLRPA